MLCFLALEKSTPPYLSPSRNLQFPGQIPAAQLKKYWHQYIARNTRCNNKKDEFVVSIPAEEVGSKHIVETAIASTCKIRGEVICVLGTCVALIHLLGYRGDIFFSSTYED